MLSEESRKANKKRIAIQYEILSIPITNKKEGYKVNVCELKHNKISHLWTVIEFIDNNQCVDLITGEIYGSQLSEEDILDTVTQEYETEALEIKERLLQNPLAIGSISSRYNICKVLIKPLNTEAKIKIMASMSKIDEIKNQVELMKIEARDKIEKYYQDKNAKKMLEMQEQAEKKDQEFDKKRRQEAWEQERARLQKYIRRSKARKQEIVDEKFDTLFPVDASTKILTKCKN